MRCLSHILLFVRFLWASLYFLLILLYSKWTPLQSVCFWCHALLCACSVMMTSLNGNIFRVTGHLCGEFTGPGEVPAQRPVTRSFDVFFDLRLNKRLSKQSWGWWFETLSHPLWRHRNVCLFCRIWGRSRFSVNSMKVILFAMYIHAPSTDLLANGFALCTALNESYLIFERQSRRTCFLGKIPQYASYQHQNCFGLSLYDMRTCVPDAGVKDRDK